MQRLLLLLFFPVALCGGCASARPETTPTPMTAREAQAVPGEASEESGLDERNGKEGPLARALSFPLRVLVCIELIPWVLSQAFSDSTKR